MLFGYYRENGKLKYRPITKEVLKAYAKKRKQLKRKQKCTVNCQKKTV